nr:hypothetical protein [Tanacetum cinerariifolium]
MIEYHSVDMRLKDLMMMVLVMHTEDDDTVLHMEKTGMWMLVVEIDIGGMTADVIDKLTCSSDVVQPRRESIQKLHVYLKFFQFHIIDIHVVQEQ